MGCSQGCAVGCLGVAAGIVTANPLVGLAVIIGAYIIARMDRRKR